VKWLDEPLMAHKDLVTFITNGGEKAFEKVSRATAYRDIDSVRAILGNIKTAAKSWVRHVVYEELTWAMKTAREKKYIEGVVMAADKLAKYFKLDKDDLELTDWEQFPQPNFEPSGDIELLNIKGLEGKTQQDLKMMRINIRKRLNMKVEEAEIVESGKWKVHKVCKDFNGVEN
jgi:hypothetical protein